MQPDGSAQSEESAPEVGIVAHAECVGYASDPQGLVRRRELPKVGQDPEYSSSDQNRQP